MDAPFNWTCPHCGRDTTISEYNFEEGFADFGRQWLSWEYIVCPNKKCGKFTIACKLRSYEQVQVAAPPGVSRQFGKTWFDRRLVPSSSARVFPDYIPIPIRSDYEEACAIVDLSPKASATLARRCLQGMIRDFWGVSKPKLIQEIQELQGRVDPDVWGVIDALRKVGNIGAHMEADIDVIVDVDDQEAAKLIWLIELLMKEWYIARHDRQERGQQVIAVAQAKQTAKVDSTKP